MNKNIMLATVVATLMNIGLQAYEGLPASVAGAQSTLTQAQQSQIAPPSTTAQPELNQAPPSTTADVQQAVAQAPLSTTADTRQAATSAVTNRFQNSSTVQSIKQNVPQTGRTGKFGFF